MLRQGTYKGAVLAVSICLAAATMAIPPAIASSPDPGPVAPRTFGEIKPCPKPANIYRPAHIKGAAAALLPKIGANPKFTTIVQVLRAPKAKTSWQGVRECGRKVNNKSVVVRIEPKGENCSTCSTGYFLAKHKGGGWILWFLDDYEKRPA